MAATPKPIRKKYIKPMELRARNNAKIFENKEGKHIKEFKNKIDKKNRKIKKELLK